MKDDYKQWWMFMTWTERSAGSYVGLGLFKRKKYARHTSLGQCCYFYKHVRKHYISMKNKQKINTLIKQIVRKISATLSAW